MKNMHGEHAALPAPAGVGILGVSGILAFMTSSFAWVVWAIMALVVADILLNVSDEQKQLPSLVRALAAAIVPYGLQWLGGNDGHPGLFFRIGLTIALGVLLTNVGPQIIQKLGALFASNKVEAAAVESAAQATIANLMAENQKLQQQLQGKNGG